ALLPFARALVLRRSAVCRLDEGPGRGIFGSLSAIHPRALFRGMLLAARGGAARSRVAERDAYGPQGTPRAAARDDARRQDDGRGARRRVEQPRSYRPVGSPQRPPDLTSSNRRTKKDARGSSPGIFFCALSPEARGGSNQGRVQAYSRRRGR